MTARDFRLRINTVGTFAVPTPGQEPALSRATEPGIVMQGGAMGADFTEPEIRAVFQIDSGEAKQHARCGPMAGCRRAALARVDEDLDAYLTLALPNVRPAPASAISRS